MESEIIEKMVGYESPITVIQERINMNLENDILKAVQKVDVIVDKEELIKALRYDRNQYDKGFAHGCDETARQILTELFDEDGCRHGWWSFPKWMVIEYADKWGVDLDWENEDE